MKLALLMFLSSAACDRARRRDLTGFVLDATLPLAADGAWRPPGLLERITARSKDADGAYLTFDTGDRVFLPWDDNPHLLPADDGRDRTRPTRRPGMFSYTIEDGEHVLMVRRNGTMEELVGPRRAEVPRGEGLVAPGVPDLRGRQSDPSPRRARARPRSRRTRTPDRTGRRRPPARPPRTRGRPEPRAR